MTVLPQAQWRPGPAWKRGYGGTTWLPLTYKEGEVKHSAEGSVSAAFGVLDGPRQSSWHFTLPKQPPVRFYQHYHLEDICWHCGLPGDESSDTSLIGNITLFGEEHEGVAGEPLTAWQVENSTLLSLELRARCIKFRMNPPILRVNEWEHNWLSPAPTACPSGRIPWMEIIARINAAEEGDMTSEELKRAIREVLREPEFAVGVRLGHINRRVGDPEDGSPDNPALLDVRVEVQQHRAATEQPSHP